MKKGIAVLAIMLILSTSALAHRAAFKHCHTMAGNYTKYVNVFGDMCHNHYQINMWHCEDT